MLPRCRNRSRSRAFHKASPPPPHWPNDRRRSFSDSGNRDRKSTRLNSSHSQISYAVFCLKKKRPSYCYSIFSPSGVGTTSEFNVTLSTAGFIKRNICSSKILTPEFRARCVLYYSLSHEH